MHEHGDEHDAREIDRDDEWYGDDDGGGDWGGGDGWQGGGDYRNARRGGSGTNPGPRAGRHIIENGTCRQSLWPDETDAPLVSEQELARDAARFRIGARALPVRVGDLRRVLSAGCPVVVSMNTGPQFASVGRDGMVRVSERAQGQHGRHAMLIVGYRSNYFILKNSWGTSWGDNGYCYVPKRVLAQSDPELIAMAIGERPSRGAGARGVGTPSGPPPSWPPTGAPERGAGTPSKCPTCLAPTTPGAQSCAYLGGTL